jgi:hypothetical protein
VRVPEGVHADDRDRGTGRLRLCGRVTWRAPYLIVR